MGVNVLQTFFTERALALRSSPKSKSLKDLARLRCLVGYLGQKNQSGWWDCQFLDATGFRFLATTFPRTFHSAALRSTTEAARLVHDKAMGRTGTFHLFHMPPDLIRIMTCAAFLRRGSKFLLYVR